MYASMPKYVLRMVGDGAMPEWYANVNPLVVVLCVVPVTHLVRKLSPTGSIAVALGLIPLSAAIMGFSTRIGALAAAAGVATHPVTIAMVLGISLQGFAECFLAPRYLEFASKQAPPGQEGLYLGYAHLNTFFAWFVGFVLSGYLLEAFCPDPGTLSQPTGPRASPRSRATDRCPPHTPTPTSSGGCSRASASLAFAALMMLRRGEGGEAAATSLNSRRSLSLRRAATRFDTVSRPSRPASRQVPQRHAVTARRATQCARHTGHVCT